MKQLIILTRVSDREKVYVNPEQICSVYKRCGHDTTIVKFNGENCYENVLEDPMSVANMWEGAWNG